jgi:signal transduction histidine kinase
MRRWLRGLRGGAAAFVAIAALVAGGLGWVTAAALRLEREQLEARAAAERQAQLQLALSLLDSAVRPALAREDGRPYHHYSALSALSQALDAAGRPLLPGAVLEPSPLLSARLPDWMLLHFQADDRGEWSSPQVPVPAVRRRLDNPRFKAPLGNATPERARLLAELGRQVGAGRLLAAAREHGAEPTVDDTVLLPASRTNEPGTNAFSNLAGNPLAGQPQQSADYGAAKRAEQQARSSFENRAMNQKEAPEVANSILAPNEDWGGRFSRPGARSAEVEVVLSPMVPLWLTGGDGRDRLLFARVVRVADRQVVQGVLLDDGRLREELAAEVADLFPGARLEAVREDEVPDAEAAPRTMTALPFRLDPGPAPAVADPGWTPLRGGLCLAWAAALVALGAVGLGGWSLIDLSERRIRFVSAVTHELRTPLTTLRLYLDMLTGGLVREEGQRQEYLWTLHAEAERLHRLIGNVLDFARLENQRPRLVPAPVAAADLLGQAAAAWAARCRDAGKELVVEDAVGDVVVRTDAELVQQVLGNLIDNACKYSREAADNRVWLRARRGEAGRLWLEVEDRGPGVPARERRAVFRPFRRGRGADVTAGGVGLGLALAARWARLLGGQLTLHPGRDGTGACFQLELPASGGGGGGGGGGRGGGRRAPRNSPPPRTFSLPFLTRAEFDLNLPALGYKTRPCADALGNSLGLRDIRGKGAAAMKNMRKKIWIDRFQTYLFLRIAFYFVAYQVGVWCLVFLEQELSTSLERMIGEARTGYFFVALALALMAVGFVFIYDSVVFLHKIVGPLYRLRQVIRAVTAGEEVTLVAFRQGDHLQELKDEFNAMLRVLEQRGAVALKVPEAKQDREKPLPV